jgi:mannosidase alpha-like ER degradation enhancer 1
MDGFLPVLTKPPTPSHMLPEVLLRFSSTSSGSNEVFLHGMAATATFGKDFSVTSDSRSTLSMGGPSVLLQRPKTNLDGCNAFLSSEIVTSDGEPPLLVLDRGGCTFFHKALNAKQAGVSGIIIIGHPPIIINENFEGDQTEYEEGLIRPSADQEPDYLLSQIGREFGVLYVEHVVGRAVVDKMNEEAEGVGVEMIDLRKELMGESSTGNDRKEGEAQGRGGERRNEEARREARVMVAGWDIRNLRIVDRPPD